LIQVNSIGDVVHHLPLHATTNDTKKIKNWGKVHITKCLYNLPSQIKNQNTLDIFSRTQIEAIKCYNYELQITKSTYNSLHLLNHKTHNISKQNVQKIIKTIFERKVDPYKIKKAKKKKIPNKCHGIISYIGPTLCDLKKKNMDPWIIIKKNAFLIRHPKLKVITLHLCA